MPRYKITIEYDGTFFSGWQFQKDTNSVQEILENACTNLCGTTTKIYGSSRTDKGVHATNQVAHVDINCNLSEYSIICGINFYLHKIFNAKIKNIKKIIRSSYNNTLNTNNILSNKYDQSNHIQILKTKCDMKFLDLFMPHLCPISVTKIEMVSDSFHARFCAKKRKYVYMILNQRFHSPIAKNRVWHVRQQLNIEDMQKAAQLFIGTHDFSNFRSSDCQSKYPVKTIDVCEVKISNHLFYTISDHSSHDLEYHINKNNNIIEIHVESQSFLHSQVRMMVHAIKSVGTGQMTLSDITKYLLNDSKMLKQAAPACGLYLANVSY